MPNDGFIKLYRKMLTWGWYDEPYTKAVFLHLLFLAQYEETFYRGVHLNIGQAVATLPEISIQNGISVQNVRTAIEHLKATGELTACKYSKFTVYTLKNYDSYNGGNRQLTDNQQATNSLPTGNQQATNRQPTGLSVIKKERKKEYCAFDAFWAAYPKKKAKGDAQKAWAKLKPDEPLLAAILKAVEAQKATEQWKRDGGQYIPYPASWLNGRRWEDEAEKPLEGVKYFAKRAD